MTIPSFDLEWCGYPASAFSVRDTDVLAAIGEEGLTVFTFDGLKRRLGLHSETLSRILVRLEDEGLIKKTMEGYTVTSRIDKVLKLHSPRVESSCVSLLRTYLPSDVSIQQLTSDLKGRWFGLLRWLGMSENGEGVALKWVTEDGDIQVDAKISENTLAIEAKFLHRHNSDLALKAAYQLMTHIGKLCTRSQIRGPVARTVGYVGNSNFYMNSA
jgi:hypothetical protein